MTPSRRGGVGARLRHDLNQAGVSARGLARQLVGSDATRDEIETKRRQVTAWLGLTNHHGMSLENAQAVALLLGTDHRRYLSPMYDPIQQAKRRAERLAAAARAAREEVRRRTKEQGDGESG